MMLAIVVALSLQACGGPTKTVPATDQTAIDQFTDAARRWTIEGSDPWYTAFKSGDPAKLSAVAPAAESAMSSSVAAMAAAASKLGTVPVRTRLIGLVATYRAKLAAIREIDSASNDGSPTRLQAGIADLKAAGTAAVVAFRGFARSAKQSWGSDPLSDFKIG